MFSFTVRASKGRPDFQGGGFERDGPLGGGLLGVPVSRVAVA